MSNKNNGFFTVSRSVFWGLVLILAAAALILDGVGFSFGIGITLWHVIGGVILLSWIVSECVKLRFHAIFFPLAFLFMLFEGVIASWLGREDPNMISNWTLLLAALLLTIGVGALTKRSGGRENARLGNSTLYFDANDPGGCIVSDNVGNIHVYFINKEHYNGLGVVSVRNSVGKVTLHVPSEWNVVTECKDTLGSVNVPEREQVAGKSITVSVRDSVGSVTVEFV